MSGQPPAASPARQPPVPVVHEVDLPAGGVIQLQTAEEVQLWETSSKRYVEDYHLSKNNDLVLLGAILQQQVELFRAQRILNGMEPELDAANVPTGRYRRVELDADDRDKANRRLNVASGEIRTLEKALGIDKVSREAGGTITVASYIDTLKRAAHERGIHISKRVLAYEAFVNDLRWRLRLLRNGDAEDRAYHDLTPDKVLDWAFEELAQLEEVDKKFAKEKGKVYVGRL